MTTKEAVALLERYSNYDGIGIPNLAGCKEAMKVAVDALKEAYLENQKEQPFLPDNLDEAARKIVIKMHPCLKDCTILGDRLTRGELMALVKAGAEWMAGQGVILNLSIDELSCGAYNACVEQGLTSEDNVIIQIRKKEENHD